MANDVMYQRQPRESSFIKSAMGSDSPANSILESLRVDGFVVISNLTPPSFLTPLREAAARAISKARDETENGWPHVYDIPQGLPYSRLTGPINSRIVGKQFPPWPKGVREDVWGVQHIMHPDLHEPVFSQWYGSQAVLDVVTTILGCTEDDLQHGNFQLRSTKGAMLTRILSRALRLASEPFEDTLLSRLAP